MPLKALQMERLRPIRESLVACELNFHALFRQLSLNVRLLRFTA